MQPQQVKNAFPPIAQHIDEAARLCQTSSNVPEELRKSVSELARESGQAKSTLAQEQNEQNIVACVDRLEKLADRAMQACKQSGNNIDEPLRQAVWQAHGGLSDLKHRVHEPVGT